MTDPKQVAHRLAGYFCKDCSFYEFHNNCHKDREIGVLHHTRHWRNPCEKFSRKVEKDK